MFSLIITIISIALVAALAVATIYYGGDAFNQGSSKANASTMVNHAQQIAGANTMLRATTGAYADGTTDADRLAALETAEYLSSVPTMVGVTYGVDADNNVFATGLNAEVCDKLEEVAGRGIAGDATSPDPLELAADAAAVLTANPTVQFGCAPVGNATTNAPVFFFRG